MSDKPRRAEIRKSLLLAYLSWWIGAHEAQPWAAINFICAAGWLVAAVVEWFIRRYRVVPVLASIHPERNRR